MATRYNNAINLDITNRCRLQCPKCMRQTYPNLHKRGHDISLENVEKISKDKQVVIHCKSGKRSATVISALESHHAFTNLYNLKGGILAYIEEIGL